MATVTNAVDRRIMDTDRVNHLMEVAEGLPASIETSARGGVIHTKIILSEDVTLISAGDAAAKAGGTELFTFPTGKLVIQCSRVKGRLTLSNATMTTTAGELGIGTVVASGAVAVLGGTATFENIHQGGVPALGNITAGAIINAACYDETRALVPAIGDGFNASAFLNAATTFADDTAANLVALAGTEIEIWYILMEQ